MSRAGEDVTTHDYGFASHGAMEVRKMDAHRGHTWGRDEHGITRCTLCGLLRTVYVARRVQPSTTIDLAPPRCGYVTNHGDFTTTCTSPSPCAVHDDCEGR